MSAIDSFYCQTRLATRRCHNVIHMLHDQKSLSNWATTLNDNSKQLTSSSSSIFSFFSHSHQFLQTNTRKDALPTIADSVSAMETQCNSNGKFITDRFERWYTCIGLDGRLSSRQIHFFVVIKMMWADWLSTYSAVVYWNRLFCSHRNY